MYSVEAMAPRVEANPGSVGGWLLSASKIREIVGTSCSLIPHKIRRGPIKPQEALWKRDSNQGGSFGVRR